MRKYSRHKGSFIKGIIIYIKKDFLKIGIISFVFLFIGIFFQYPSFQDGLDNKKIPNINGRRSITFIIQKSSYNPYIGMKTDYNIFINSDKSKIIGKGEKWSVNGENLDYSLHDKIKIEGTISQKRLYGIYTLEGKNRITDGQIEVEIDKKGKTFSGKFYGNGADVSGDVFGNKK